MIKKLCPKSVPQKIDIRIPLEIVLPKKLSPQAAALRQLPENRTPEDNELVKKLGGEMVEILEEDFKVRKMNVVEKQMTGLKGNRQSSY